MSTGTSPEATPPSRRSMVAYFGVLAVLVAITYGQVATAFFVADDFNVLKIVSTATTLREATGVAAGWGFFRPLTALTYWGTYALFGLEPTAFHVTDLLLHTCNAFMVAWLAWLVFPHRLGAAFAGACFAVLPTGAECVTWIAGRFDVLCVTGALMCIGGFMKFLRGGGPGAVLLTALGLVIGLLAKDTGIILPVFLVFLAVVPTSETWRTRPLGQIWPVLAGLVAVFAVYFIIRLYVLGGFGGYQDDDGSKHLIIDPVNALQFCRDAVHSVLAPGTHWVLATLACGLGATILAGGIRGTVGRLAPLVVCFLIGLLPAANTVALDMVNGEGARFLYLPSVFACVGLGIVFGQATTVRSMRIFAALAVLLLGSYGWTLITINQRWRVAGDMAETIVLQLRALSDRRDYESLFIHDLPDHHQGAFVFRNGFETALELFVSETLEFPLNGRISRAVWDEHAAKRRADPSHHADKLLLRWMPDTRRLIEP